MDHKENRPHEEGGTRSGGPMDSIARPAGHVPYPEFVPGEPPFDQMPVWWVLRKIPRGTLLSTIPCGVCGVDVVYQHPLAKWQFDLLPDESWSRCSRCAPVEVPA